MIDRRTFALNAAGALGALTLTPGSVLGEQLRERLELPDSIRRALELAPAQTPEALAKNETFWSEVRKLYALRDDVVNLDHGWTLDAGSWPDNA